MHSASPPYQCPSTPLAPRNPLAYKPLNSSPLNACSSDWYNSSPVAAAQAHRRRSQYKTLTPNTPTRVFSNSRRSSGRLFTDGGYIATPSRPDSQKLSLRNRFKARCFERAAKARERAIKGKRYTNQPSSDDFTMDYDDEDEDDDEDIMQDEIFRRIMANATRKEHHSYRISYAQEVGSSIDPDLEDVASWEQELADSVSASHHDTTTTTKPPQEEELTPIDLDDEELAAYAEECAALADFDDIPEEELFSWSDFEEPDDEHGYDMDVA